MGHHEHVILLDKILAIDTMHRIRRPHLLIPDGEFALGLLVVLRKGLKFLDCLILEDSGKELHVLFRVLVARLYAVQPSDQMKHFTMETHIDLGVVG